MPDWKPRFIDPLFKLAQEAKRPISNAELSRWIEEAQREAEPPKPSKVGSIQVFVRKAT